MAMVQILRCEKPQLGMTAWGHNPAQNAVSELSPLTPTADIEVLGVPVGFLSSAIEAADL